MVTKPTSVDAYIDSYPPEVQRVLREVRRSLHEAVPDAGERISYQIPTLTLEGRPLVYFAGWSKHVSVYPLPDADEALSREMAPYIAGKGTLRFPLDRPVPYALIQRLARTFVEQRETVRD
ncbi:iron chaperone [Streptomyces oceani]|uniref:YdhG-like domain-containing protein n=1 Tax=Streptomyces oceani TaxID=1075402 RepID=A0A1E7KHT0_9ACTN|nr:DUF1801 domain-containing protein [Streptomyces oceani]OEV03436.1 hypothetical protein AN216_11230 [Streptomyces oceani]